MEQIISKEELDELIKIKGEMRGITIKPGTEFVLREEGEEGLKELGDTMAELGYPIEYKKMKPLDLYPMGLIAISLLTTKRFFNYDDKKFQEMGRFCAKVPFLVRVFIMGRVFSINRIMKEAPRMWKKYFTVGEFKVIELNEEKKYIVSRLENFVLHPLYCKVFGGFISAICKMIVKNPVTCEETKCVHRGDNYHEFLLKW